jgi:acyl-CoA reductase-like NAD-dependent aldehyde dehydrogenase
LSRFEYAPAPESRAIVDIKSSYGLFINGVFTEATDGKPFKTVSPASEEVLAEVSEAGPADVDRAVKAARKAYEKVWGPMPGRDRAKYLYRIARLIQERSRELAVLESSTTASRSASPATSTCRWSPRTSSTTRAGRTSWSTPAPAPTRSRWESPRR